MDDSRNTGQHRRHTAVDDGREDDDHESRDGREEKCRRKDDEKRCDDSEHPEEWRY